jgi:5'-nucleotidase
VKITILHTNDWHRRSEPFPDDGEKFAGRGGAVYRASIINEILRQEKNVLLLDAGVYFGVHRILISSEANSDSN